MYISFPQSVQVTDAGMANGHPFSELSVTINGECLHVSEGENLQSEMCLQLSPFWRCNILRFYLQLFPKSACKKQSAEKAKEKTLEAACFQGFLMFRSFD